MVDHLHNFACIGMWVPFNEGWGQFEASAVADWLKSYDPTRPVDHASGNGENVKTLDIGIVAKDGTTFGSFIKSRAVEIPLITIFAD
jgi:hypothetical protein